MTRSERFSIFCPTVIRLTRLLIVLFIFPLGFVGWAAEPEKSAVQIIAFVQQPVWDAPWRFESVQKFTGSGFVIQGKRIMTNAHVVSWARQILIKRPNDAHQYAARVTYIGHDCDLAILEVQEPGFFDGMEPLPFGSLPKVRTAVVTYGYPAGGNEISYTKGVVSRIEVQPYVHIGNRSFLAIQTDAAINPGNSGGPVLQDGKVVGVAFQGISGLENTGYFIPPPIIEHFLKDIEDGHYDGFPKSGISLASLENASYRRLLKMPGNADGVRVDQIFDAPTTSQLIHVDDVILQIKSYKVGSDGTVEYEGNRVQASFIFSMMQNGEKIPLKIWRDGKEMEISLPMMVYDGDRAEGNQYQTLPRYYVYGGMVFVPLNLNYLRTFGRDWMKEMDPELRYELFFRNYEHPEARRKEPVVLASILSHPVNADLKIRKHGLVDQINHVRIECMEDVIRAFESNPQSYDVVEFATQRQMECLDHNEIARVNAEILKTYRVAKDRQL